MRAVRRRLLLLFAVVIGTSCARRQRQPDITGVITWTDNAIGQVEVDPTDPNIGGRGTDKAEISNLTTLLSGKQWKVGCVVNVWFDESIATLDSYPEKAVAESVQVVRCL